MSSKNNLSSKKLAAYLVAELTWKAALIVALYYGAVTVSLAIVAVAAFVEVVYIGKQADLDRYVRLAEIGASTNKKSDDPIDGSGEGHTGDRADDA